MYQHVGGSSPVRLGGSEQCQPRQSAVPVHGWPNQKLLSSVPALVAVQHPPCARFTFAYISVTPAGSGDDEGAELTILQFLMPEDDEDDGYGLLPVTGYTPTDYLLPIQSGSGADIAPDSSVVWMAVSGRVRTYTAYIE